MSRLRITLFSAAMMVALAALTLNSLAQQPGRNGGGPGGGPGGFFGRGGGPGGPGNSLLSLASNPAVQEDMKVKDKQKAQIKTLSDKFNVQSREMWTQMGGGPGGPGGPGGGPPGGGPNAQGKGGRRQGQNGQANANGQVDVQAQGNAGFGGVVDNGQIQDPNAPGFNPNQGQGGGGQGGGGRGNRGPGGQQDPARAQQFAMMREAMDELTQGAETSLGKILDKTQATRLKQIQLQLQGPGAILREDMMEKLGIDESQIQMLDEVRSNYRTAQRDNGRARRDVMKAVFAKAMPTQNNGQNADNAANGGNGGNNGNGNAANGNGGNGNGRNGGRGNRGRPDPEAMKKAMEDPQIQAQMDQMNTQDQKLENQFSLAIAKVLTPRQRALYKKMIGAPFDKSKMGTGGPWGGRGGNGPGGNPATAKAGATAGKTATATTKSNADDDLDESSTTAKPATTTPAPAKTKAATTTPRKKSLRELRGSSSDSKDQ
jgi:hypothetical protein